MKSFVAYPIELGSVLHPSVKQDVCKPGVPDDADGIRRIKHLDGIIVKCGVTHQEGFARFDLLNSIVGEALTQKMVAFEKKALSINKAQKHEGATGVGIEGISSSILLKKKGAVKHEIEFIPGDVCQTIPEYLIENPESKIVLLNIDLNDYESTITALEFLYPRIVQYGILILENYSGSKAQKSAVDDYFAPGKLVVHSFSGGKTAHYLVKE
ncbi:hypothetical protein EXU57_22415 [Segetibacter sp. 3557_3]|uniref:TylF/MycF/NovP-related O-methyltransferase n=1 Tax=Segetibacter sp. 3557_3 TaxID=2547429 RepID=UPI0010590F9C|nr:TylF/MycF/NovP-related O-methyltransferase [Segetibacter sp. 3557_3]TDH19815.1 hypothetical protein EXU57_22415 [Segetibacter sp. 3557_3]